MAVVLAELILPGGEKKGPHLFWVQLGASAANQPRYVNPKPIDPKGVSRTSLPKKSALCASGQHRKHPTQPPPARRPPPALLPLLVVVACRLCRLSHGRPVVPVPGRGWTTPTSPLITSSARGPRCSPALHRLPPTGPTPSTCPYAPHTTQHPFAAAGPSLLRRCGPDAAGGVVRCRPVASACWTC